MFALSAICARYTGRLSDRVDSNQIAMVGFAILASGVGSLVLLLLSSNVNLWMLLPSLLVCGVGIGAISAPLAALAFRGVEPALAGAASGVFNTTRQVGGALGSAATGLLLQTYTNRGATSATRIALIFPIVMLLVGLCCSAVLYAKMKRNTHPLSS